MLFWKTDKEIWSIRATKHHSPTQGTSVVSTCQVARALLRGKKGAMMKSERLIQLASGP